MSDAWCPRLIAAMMAFAFLVQRNETGFSLVSATKRLAAAWKETKERNTPRFSRRLISLAEKSSTALSQATPEVCAGRPRSA